MNKNITRRSVLAAIATLPFTLTGSAKLENKNDVMGGITILASYWREKNWLAFAAFYDKVVSIFNNVDKYCLDAIIANRMHFESDNIHYITVTGGNTPYVHFKFLDSELSLAEPINLSM